ncbi:TetR family transcriptional regulator [Actinocatenispora thailandica]|uniref:TetR family transcriptional regulator n=1 Tax=Actinocatenispora thailandica TaxID=227318 RepID=A0A7R7DQG4_9ACTN|nr:TetR/AcrR family transcriptional regulator C-terminal domain-containing protein [Actinocatenispora thailandica]BCJ35765.1 TetR family transcriptional regulator [Actinocatenispora thailandica]
MAVRKDALALLWERPPAGRRGPKPTLTHDRIAAAGVALADAEGLTAVTMQRVAEALEVTKMALYRYVPGKAELIALMTEAALGGPPELPAGPWRPAMDAWARHIFAGYLRHPWALSTTVGPRPVGPNELAWMEVACARLAGTGLTGGEMLDVAATLIGHVRSIAQQDAAAGSASPERNLQEGMVAVLRAHRDRYPALTAALDATVEHGGSDQALDFGLDRILDGVELLVARRDGS